MKKILEQKAQLKMQTDSLIEGLLYFNNQQKRDL